MVAPVSEQFGQLAGDRGRRQDVPHRRFRKQVGMPPQGPAELDHAVGFELPLQRFQLVVDHREVEAQGDVAALLSGRLPPDVGTGEGSVEVAGPEAVVVVLQQRDPQRLAESPRTDPEGVALLLQAAQEAGLVDVQPAVQADAPKVALAVRNARVNGSLVHSRNLAAVTLSLSGTGAQWRAGGGRSWRRSRSANSQLPGVSTVGPDDDRAALRRPRRPSTRRRFSAWFSGFAGEGVAQAAAPLSGAQPACDGQPGTPAGTRPSQTAKPGIFAV